MPKQENKECVIQDWIMDLPFTQQALLLLSLRGADGIPKHHHTKTLIRWIRGVVLKPAYKNFNRADGFMSIDYTQWREITTLCLELHDEIPHHFLMHLVHAIEVIGYKHPNSDIGERFLKLYLSYCDSFHMNPESESTLDNRLRF
ncbi:MAG TPA: hypothetical protein VF679_13150 [Pedobacter sp.]|jgi:hypothetical protein